MFSSSKVEMNKQNMSAKSSQIKQGAQQALDALVEFGKLSNNVPDDKLVVDGVSKTTERDGILDLVNTPLAELVIRDATGKEIIKPEEAKIADLLTDVIRRTTG